LALILCRRRYRKCLLLDNLTNKIYRYKFRPVKIDRAILLSATGQVV